MSAAVFFLCLYSAPVYYCCVFFAALDKIVKKKILYLISGVRKIYYIIIFEL